MAVTSVAVPPGRIVGDLPQPISFRTERFSAGTEFPHHSRPWGELNFALSGVCEVDVGGHIYLSPPSYGLWIPPRTPHAARTRVETVHASTYVADGLLDHLPPSVQTIALSPLLKAIVAYFSARGITVPRTAEDMRMAMVLVDQIASAPHYAAYLPLSDDPVIRPVIDALRADPGDQSPLDDWAARSAVSTRTLTRHWNAALGLGFAEWRQRLRLVASLPLLEEGYRVSEVAKKLGYGGSSAFIAMFKRLTGVSPTQIHVAPLDPKS